mmetsp:Transcript_24136/g.73853  ORF Transcript_24136/g.73853 Transcript_24136/m.73853 type:complete len:413 (+) Transcript_24136:249-1487(+)
MASGGRRAASRSRREACARHSCSDTVLAVRHGEVGATHEEVGRLANIDVTVKLLGFGERRVLGILDSLGDLRLDRLLNLLDLGLAHEACLKAVALSALDRVARRADAGNLVAVAVGNARVGHRVAMVAVSVHLDDNGAVIDGIVLDELGGLPDGEDIHAVYLDARHVMAPRVIVVVGRAALLGGAHAVLVVLAHVDERQLPQGGHVEGFEELPLIGRAVAVQRKGAAAVATVLGGEREAGADGGLRADDAIAAIEIGISLVHVHRATFAFSAAALLAEQLRQHAFDRVATCKLLAVVAVRGDEGVAQVACRFHPHANGLLPVVQVAEALDMLALIERVGRDLHATHAVHERVVAEELVTGDQGLFRGRALEVVGEEGFVERHLHPLRRSAQPACRGGRAEQPAAREGEHRTR